MLTTHPTEERTTVNSNRTATRRRRHPGTILPIATNALVTASCSTGDWRTAPTTPADETPSPEPTGDPNHVHTFGQARVTAETAPRTEDPGITEPAFAAAVDVIQKFAAATAEPSGLAQ